MNPLTIKLIMSDIGAVSDRTARQLMKDLSKLCLRAQVRELEAVMKYLNLNRREQQSIRDKIALEMHSGPKYYIKSIETGSIEIAVIISAFGIWFLQATIGETIKDAWKLTKIHKGIIAWMSTERKEELPKFIFEEIEKHDFLSGRAVATDGTQDDADNIIEINLQKSDFFEIERKSPIVDDEVISQGLDYLDRLDSERDS